ncbi:hypothetical protein C8Q77DRAFT_577612 [Trametes polyzona]|nr:hypothetical protein C8Q77DRAFT_577612 [Trametes polyzona]
MANPSSLELDLVLQSDFSKIWASHQFQPPVKAQWSDYGYFERQTTQELFVRLGNIYDVVRPTGKLSTFLLRRLEGREWVPAIDYPWPQEDVSHAFELSREEGERLEEIAVVRTLPDDCEYRDFFWEHTERIAEDNGLKVHDIVLCTCSEEIFHYAGAFVGCEPSPHTDLTTSEALPERIFFHQLPLLGSGDAPSPWGYWSLYSEPTPGPWPSFEIPGVELTCSVRSNYARVSTFEGEMLVYLNQLRRARDRASDASRAREGRGRSKEF